MARTKDPVYDETWSYPYEQIEKYLFTCGAAYDGFVYSLEECEVTLRSLPDRVIGKLHLPQTRITISGPGSEAFYHGFYLNFLSGGA